MRICDTPHIGLMMIESFVYLFASIFNSWMTTNGVQLSTLFSDKYTLGGVSK